jgi:hypothetical protein
MAPAPATPVPRYYSPRRGRAEMIRRRPPGAARESGPRLLAPLSLRCDDESFGWIVASLSVGLHFHLPQGIRASRTTKSWLLFRGCVTFTFVKGKRKRNQLIQLAIFISFSLLALLGRVSS